MLFGKKGKASSPQSKRGFNSRNRLSNSFFLDNVTRRKILKNQNEVLKHLIQIDYVNQQYKKCISFHVLIEQKNKIN